MTIYILVISFLLDGITSNFIPIEGILYPLFTLISLIVIYPYYNGDKRKFYKHSFIAGLFYDLIYTDTLIFNAFLFLLISFIITKTIKLFADNYLGLILNSLLCIIIFRTITYCLIVLTGNIHFDIDILFKGVYSSIIINIIYLIVLSSITDYLSKKLKIKKGLRYY